MTSNFYNYDHFMLALCLWREARGCAPNVISAVAHVIRNRADDPKNRWPKTIHGVILKRHQFSSFNFDQVDKGLYKADPNCGKFPLYGDPEWDKFAICLDIAWGIGQEQDPTKGANHYEDCAQLGLALPDWADQSKVTCVIGPFTFYKL